MVIHPSVGWMIVIACATLLISWTVYWDYRKKRLQFEERRVAIENGIEPPPPPVPQLAGWPGVKQVEMQLKYAERRLMIEKGLQLDECVPKPKPPLTRQDYLRRGILMTCLGVGLLLGYVLLNYVRVDGRLEAQAWCLGLGPLALLFGIGNLIYQRFAPVTTPDRRGPGLPEVRR